MIVLKAFKRGALRRKLQIHRGNLIWNAVRAATIGGIDSNRREIRISREHPEYPIAPVLRSYLWGFVIVMARGEPIDESFTLWDNRFSLPDHLQESDLFYNHNTCRFGSALRFIDYGDPTAEEVLPLLFGESNKRFAMQTE